MSQEAKVIALEHLVFSLLRELDSRDSVNRDEVVDRALASIEGAGYLGEGSQQEATEALKRAAVYISG